MRKPVTLTWSDVRALPAVAQTTTFHCVTGWTVGNVHWQGVRLQTLWDMVEPLPDGPLRQLRLDGAPATPTRSRCRSRRCPR